VEVADLVPPPPDDPEIEVRVLGPIDVLGAARPFTRAWAIELIVYLAMHPNGASSEQWATALWPDRIMAAASLHSTASAARRSLGVSASGEDHLPRAHGRLSLSDSVGSDWSRFVELSERPDPRCWGQALELIRGRPFEGLRAPDWVLLEGIAANVEASVVDLANRYAVHCLSVGDPSGAEWSARQGLRVSPYDERLYRTLLRAADAAGNPAGVESVMAELIRLVAEDVEPYDAVHPETLDLYRSLSRRTAPFASR
jgi:DNA-binding SARP family transcriptional activator